MWNTKLVQFWYFWTKSLAFLDQILGPNGRVCVYVSFLKHSLKLIPKAPENRPKRPKRKGSTSNHQFSGAMLASGGVGIPPWCFFVSQSLNSVAEEQSHRRNLVEAQYPHHQCTQHHWTNDAWNAALWRYKSWLLQLYMDMYIHVYIYIIICM